MTFTPATLLAASPAGQNRKAAVRWAEVFPRPGLVHDGQGRRAGNYCEIPPTSPAAPGLLSRRGRGTAQRAWAERRVMRDNAFPRRETPFPRAVTNRPDGPSTRREAASPHDGEHLK